MSSAVQQFLGPVHPRWVPLGPGIWGSSGGFILNLDMSVLLGNKPSLGELGLGFNIFLTLSNKPKKIKYPICSLYKHALLPDGNNSRGNKNDICQVDVFHFAKFVKERYIHHTTEMYSGFQWSTAISSKNPDCVIVHLFNTMEIIGIIAQNKPNNTLTYVFNTIKQFFENYNIKDISGIPCYITG
jgi:hypothetical protein